MNAIRRIATILGAGRIRPDVIPLNPISARGRLLEVYAVIGQAPIAISGDHISRDSDAANYIVVRAVEDRDSMLRVSHRQRSRSTEADVVALDEIPRSEWA